MKPVRHGSTRDLARVWHASKPHEHPVNIALSRVHGFKSTPARIYNSAYGASHSAHSCLSRPARLNRALARLVARLKTPRTARKHWFVTLARLERPPCARNKYSEFAPNRKSKIIKNRKSSNPCPSTFLAPPFTSCHILAPNFFPSNQIQPSPSKSSQIRLNPTISAVRPGARSRFGLFWDLLASYGFFWLLSFAGLRSTAITGGLRSIAPRFAALRYVAPGCSIFVPPLTGVADGATPGLCHMSHFANPPLRGRTYSSLPCPKTSARLWTLDLGPWTLDLGR